MKINFKIHTVLESSSIRSALVKINKSGIRGVIVTDKKRRLLGVITDGDLRKHLVKKNILDKKIRFFINRKPLFITKDKTKKINLKNIFLDKSVNFVPVLSKKGELLEIITLEEVFSKDNLKYNKLPVVIMAGGEGKRLLPLTKILPKPLLPISGKPMLESVMQQFIKQEYNNFLISLHHKANLIKNYFKSKKYSITFFKEKSKLGTAGSLKLMKKKLKGNFFLTNCDVFFDLELAQIQKFHIDNKSDMTLVVAERDFKIPYGVCEIKENGNLKKLTEKPNFNIFINTGLYLINSKLIGLIPSNYFDVTDLIKKAKVKNLKVLTYIISNNSWVDVGQKEEFKKNKNFKFSN
tara:strand:- start:519 stop:1571 length:1053 start_codon:yes stop_codon:yes gene_type:complete